MRLALLLLVGCTTEISSIPGDAPTQADAPHDAVPPVTVTFRWVYFTASGGACQDEPVCAVSSCGGMTCTCRTCASPPCTEPYVLTQRCCSADAKIPAN